MVKSLASQNYLHCVIPTLVGLHVFKGFLLEVTQVTQSSHVSKAKLDSTLNL